MGLLRHYFYTFIFLSFYSPSLTGLVNGSFHNPGYERQSNGPEVSVFKLYGCCLYYVHTMYRTRATITRSWILTIHKARILRKKPLEKTLLDFKKWVKSIQTTGYNGARTVVACLLLVVVHKLRWKVFGFFLTTYLPSLTVSTL